MAKVPSPKRQHCEEEPTEAESIHGGGSNVVQHFIPESAHGCVSEEARSKCSPSTTTHLDVSSSSEEELSAEEGGGEDEGELSKLSMDGSEMLGEAELSELSEGNLWSNDDTESYDLSGMPQPEVSHGNALFPGSSIAANELDVALMLLCQRHNLTYACQDDILKLMSITHPTPNKIPRSSHLLMKQFVNFKEECFVHRFCGNCLESLPSSSLCTNSGCSGMFSPDAVFLQLSLTRQLKERMQGLQISLMFVLHWCP